MRDYWKELADKEKWEPLPANESLKEFLVYDFIDRSCQLKIDNEKSCQQKIINRNSQRSISE